MGEERVFLEQGLVVLKSVRILLINRFQNFSAAFNRWLGESLATTQLLESAGTFKFSFVLFQRFVDGFAFFYLDNQHVIVVFLMKKFIGRKGSMN